MSNLLFNILEFIFFRKHYLKRKHENYIENNHIVGDHVSFVNAIHVIIQQGTIIKIENKRYHIKRADGFIYRLKKKEIKVNYTAYERLSIDEKLTERNKRIKQIIN
jgi:hypothetical protein